MKQERGKLQQACDLLRLNNTGQEALEYLVFIYLTHGIISRGKACELLEIDRADLDDWLTHTNLSDHEKNVTPFLDQGHGLSPKV